MLARERYFQPEPRSFQATAAREESFAILEVPLAMRARTFLCITLLSLCHPQLWSQALTKQLPPAGPAGAQSAAQAPTQAENGAQTAASSEVLPDDASVDSTIPEAHVVPPPPVGVPVKIEADAQSYVKSGGAGIYTLNGHVVIHYKDYVISADHATYNQDTSEVVANGNLHVDGGPDKAHLLATHGTMNLDAHTGHFYDVTGTLGEGRSGAEIKNVTTYI